MQLTITKADPSCTDACIEALLESEIGAVYFNSDAVIARNYLSDGISKGEVYVAIDEHGACLGYIWFSLDGAFGRFPYLRNIAVNAKFRGRGVGTALLRHCEETGFAHAGTIFLLTSDFNKGAHRLYERLGYTRVGVIPGLIRPQIGEVLMMKSRGAQSAHTKA
jgi:ribosomal protein S18 acetylase RimI-like enzyme